MRFAIVGTSGIAPAMVRCAGAKSPLRGLLHIFVNGGGQSGVPHAMGRCTGAESYLRDVCLHRRRGSRLGSIAPPSHGSWMLWSRLQRTCRFCNIYIYACSHLRANLSCMQGRFCEAFLVPTTIAAGKRGWDSSFSSFYSIF